MVTGTESRHPRRRLRKRRAPAGGRAGGGATSGGSACRWGAVGAAGGDGRQLQRGGRVRRYDRVVRGDRGDALVRRALFGPQILFALVGPVGGGALGLGGDGQRRVDAEVGRDGGTVDDAE